MKKALTVAAAFVSALMSTSAMAATCTEQIGAFTKGVPGGTPAELRQKFSNADGSWNNALIVNVVTGINSDGPKGGLVRINSLGLDKSCFTADNLKAYASAAAPITTPQTATVSTPIAAASSAPATPVARVVDGEHRHPQYEARLAELETKAAAADRKVVVASQSGDPSQIAAATAEARAARDEAKRFRDEAAGLVQQARKRVGETAADVSVQVKEDSPIDVSALYAATEALNAAKGDLANAESIETRVNALVGRAETAATKAEAAQKAAEAFANASKASATESKSWAQVSKEYATGILDWIYGNAIATLILFLLLFWLWLWARKRFQQLDGNKANQTDVDDLNEKATDTDRKIGHIGKQLGFKEPVFDERSVINVLSLKTDFCTKLRFKLDQQHYALPIIRLSDGRLAVKGEPDMVFEDPKEFVHSKLRTGKLYKFRTTRG